MPVKKYIDVFRKEIYRSCGILSVGPTVLRPYFKLSDPRKIKIVNRLTALLIMAFITAGCVSVSPTHDRKASSSALETVRINGISIWATSCWEHTKVPTVKPALHDESLTLATSWGLVLRDHLANHGIQSIEVRAPSLCTESSKRKIFRSRTDSEQLGVGTPYYVDKSVKNDMALKLGLETMTCHIGAAASEQYPAFSHTCSRLLSEESKAALLKYFGGSRYVLHTYSFGQSQSAAMSVVTTALFLPAIAVTSGVTGLAIGGPATLTGDPKLAHAAISLVDSGVHSSTRSNGSPVFSHGAFYDIRNAKVIWLSDPNRKQGVACGLNTPKSREATRVFGSLLCAM